MREVRDPSGRAAPAGRASQAQTLFAIAFSLLNMGGNKQSPKKEQKADKYVLIELAYK